MRRKIAGLCSPVLADGSVPGSILGCSHPEGQAEMDRPPVGSRPPSDLSQVNPEGPSLVTFCAYDIYP